MANSLILNLYDQQDAGSLGLLWRADNGRGNVLYLLGSIHTDRNNLYPFHKQLRDVILNAEQVSFELDFNDTDQLLEFAAMQTYPAGDSLASHISPGAVPGSGAGRRAAGDGRGHSLPVQALGPGQRLLLPGHPG